MHFCMCPKAVNAKKISFLSSLMQAVRINGLDMIRTSYGFWTIDTPGKVR